MAAPELEHRCFLMPATRGGTTQLILPHPCTERDLAILRKWLDMFEGVLTEDPTRKAEPESEEGPSCPSE